MARNKLWRKLKGLRDGDQRAGIGATPPSVALAGLPGSPWIRLGPTSTRLLRTPFLPPLAGSSSLPLLPDSTAEFGLQVPDLFPFAFTGGVPSFRSPTSVRSFVFSLAKPALSIPTSSRTITGAGVAHSFFAELLFSHFRPFKPRPGVFDGGAVTCF